MDSGHTSTEGGNGVRDDTVRAHIDLPAPGAVPAGPCVPVCGWVCSTAEPVRAVEVWHQGLRWHETTGMVPRPDVAAAFPAAVGAPWFGFSLAVCTLGLDGVQELIVVGRLAGGRRVPVGAVRVRCPASPATNPAPALRPLTVVSFGRCGTTLFMRLVRSHPEVVVPGDHPYEIRPLSYWMCQLRSLFQPAADPALPRPLDWLNLNPLGRPGPGLPAGEAGAAVAGEVRHRLAYLDDMFQRAAEAAARPAARYFAEKLDLFPATLLVDHLYPTARPVVMARDFRDMFCSMRSFNARLGYATFGREQVGSDAEHVDLLARSAGWLRRYWEARRGRAHLVRYEDLVGRPRETVRRLFEYLEVDASPAAVDAALRAAAADTDEARGHRTSPSPGASVGRWARDLEPGLRARIEDRMADELRAFGYLPDDAPCERGAGLTPASPSEGAPPRSLVG